MKRKSEALDIVNGPIFKGIVVFSVPFIISNILQALYSAADVIVLGQFASDTAVASVGATLPIHSLITNVFIGLSAGTGVAVAQEYGGNKIESLHKTVHTSAALSLLLGFVVGAIGFIISPMILEITNTPKEIIPGGVVYLRVLFAGLPSLITYNFGAAILRSIGDNKRPFYFLIIAGVANIFFNLFFVIVCKLDIIGVGLGTMISQTIAAGLVWFTLMKSNAPYAYHIKETKIYIESLKPILRIGIPSGLQIAMFSIANLIIQVAINGFGTEYIAAAVASSKIDEILYTLQIAVAQTSMIFVGQNIGAGRIDRVKKITKTSSLYILAVAITVGTFMVLFSGPLLSIFVKEPNVIKIGQSKVFMICGFYFLCGLYENFFAIVRGMGYSFVPMLGSVFGICILRIVWVDTVFKAFNSFMVLLICYPISWAVSAIIEGVLYAIYYKKLKKKMLP